VRLAKLLNEAQTLAQGPLNRNTTYKRAIAVKASLDDQLRKGADAMMALMDIMEKESKKGLIRNDIAFAENIDDAISLCSSVGLGTEKRDIREALRVGVEAKLRAALVKDTVSELTTALRQAWDLNLDQDTCEVVRLAVLRRRELAKKALVMVGEPGIVGAIDSTRLARDVISNIERSLQMALEFGVSAECKEAKAALEIQRSVVKRVCLISVSKGGVDMDVCLSMAKKLNMDAKNTPEVAALLKKRRDIARDALRTITDPSLLQSLVGSPSGSSTRLIFGQIDDALHQARLAGLDSHECKEMRMAVEAKKRLAKEAIAAATESKVVNEIDATLLLAREVGIDFKCPEAKKAIQVKVAQRLQPTDLQIKLQPSTNPLVVEALQMPKKKDGEGRAECMICFGEAECRLSTSCSHYFCETCIKMALEAILEQGQFPAICPACRAEGGAKTRHYPKGLIEDQVLTFLQNKGVISKEFQFRFMKQQNKDKKEGRFFACPAKCGHYLIHQDPLTESKIVEGSSGPRLIERSKPGMCPCGAIVCLRCHERLDPEIAEFHACGRYHKNARVDEATLRELERSGKKCPNCQKFIQKTGGCSMMMCGTHAHGNLEDAMRNGGCGLQFNWETLELAPSFYYVGGQRKTGQPTEEDRRAILLKIVGENKSNGE